MTRLGSSTDGGIQSPRGRQRRRPGSRCRLSWAEPTTVNRGWGWGVQCEVGAQPLCWRVLASLLRDDCICLQQLIWWRKQVGAGVGVDLGGAGGQSGCNGPDSNLRVN